MIKEKKQNMEKIIEKKDNIYLCKLCNFLFYRFDVNNYIYYYVIWKEDNNMNKYNEEKVLQTKENRQKIKSGKYFLLLKIVVIIY